jgi:hypothetical protein
VKGTAKEIKRNLLFLFVADFGNLENSLENSLNDLGGKSFGFKYYLGFLKMGSIILPFFFVLSFKDLCDL